MENEWPRPKKAGNSKDTPGKSPGSGGVAAADPPQAEDTMVASSKPTAMNPPTVFGKEMRSLGDFQLIRKLGEGAMGAVYKAIQVSFNRTVALKVLFPHIASNPKLVERLRREGRVMGQLDHPNIVQE